MRKGSLVWIGDDLVLNADNVVAFHYVPTSTGFVVEVTTVNGMYTAEGAYAQSIWDVLVQQASA